MSVALCAICGHAFNFHKLPDHRECGCKGFVHVGGTRLDTLYDRRAVYVQYARHRIDDEDWHGVSDAANDLRELDVEIRMLEDA